MTLAADARLAHVPWTLHEPPAVHWIAHWRIVRHPVASCEHAVSAAQQLADPASCPAATQDPQAGVCTESIWSAIPQTADASVGSSAPESVAELPSDPPVLPPAPPPPPPANCAHDASLTLVHPPSAGGCGAGSEQAATTPAVASKRTTTHREIESTAAHYGPRAAEGKVVLVRERTTLP